MNINYEQLSSHLQNTLAKIYLVTSDEILLRESCCQKIVNHAKKQDFERIILDGNTPNIISELSQEIANYSLFSSHKIIDLRFNKATFDPKLKKYLIEICENLNQDQIILLRLPKLTGNYKTQGWFKAISQTGVIIQIWPIKKAQLPTWVKKQMARHQLSTHDEGYQIISDFAEGNLLGIHQEIKKLSLIHSSGFIEVAELKKSLIRNNRFDVFALGNALFSNSSRRVLKILNTLKAQGAEPILILWAITQELNRLIKLKPYVHSNYEFNLICKQERIWTEQQNNIKLTLQKIDDNTLYNLLQYAKRIDEGIKGINPCNIWDKLTSICLAFIKPEISSKILL